MEELKEKIKSDIKKLACDKSATLGELHEALAEIEDVALEMRECIEDDMKGVVT